ncbi:MAG: Dyp-type peroxidase [Caulobacteraceae bacterium]
MPAPITELDDIQALAKAGYGPLPDACHLLLQVKDGAAAHAWLKAFRPTAMADLKTHLKTAVHIAISAPGLKALGVDEAVIGAFSEEFVAGMASDPARSRRLGDVAANAPAGWAWGGPGAEPHLALLLFAEADGLDALRASLITPAFEAAFAHTELATARRDGREPFGFLDGLSQPEVDWDGKRTPGGLPDLDYGNAIAAGEFLLGYANEYGLYTGRPLLDRDPSGLLPPAEDQPGKHDLARNGSYLVIRQLEQDVEGFWAFVKDRGGEALAEAMVGRKLGSGEPLATMAQGPIRGVGPDQDDLRYNAFTFDSDAEGRLCPYSGHIRRANPRTGDIPGGDQGFVKMLASMLGLRVDRRADTIASSRFHRILRRGRKYGAPGGPQGLHFMALNANLSRQFEFIQGAWLNSPKFAGMTAEQDPLLGSRQPLETGQATDAFRQPQAGGPCRELGGLPPFVTVKGGAYFFMPGLRALRWIAEGG